mmetsp:Transcript_38275/g.89894  ORF Transcript_38275/g.89894 Transcript_38275/m.89894 type:complete len:747 (-) Transcript_38275:95-2335(-)
MRRFLIGCCVLLVVLWGAKVVLLQLAVSSSNAGLSSEEGDASAEGDAADTKDTRPWTTLRVLNPKEDTQALTHLISCIELSAGFERAKCQNLLGEMYLAGAVGGERNMSKAMELFKDAADLGDMDAQYNLGVLYSGSQDIGEDGGKRREALAVLHFYAASTAGHPGALMAMGYRHMHGYGVPKMCSTAAMNYIEIAKQIANVYSAGMPQAVELVRLNLHQKDRKVISSSEMSLFAQIATSGDTTVAASIGKRYLLGIEGFKQDYKKAARYLNMAAQKNHPAALALLGYMYCLGLGMPQNMDLAYSYFVTAATQNDPLGHNGVGYIYFRGTKSQTRNDRLAFQHFNESAFGGSSDGMFNLASMYLTGTGVDQSFPKAVLWYTQALDRGHTPAAYSLAVMHLNGIGTVRDCDIAVNLLKKVCERGEWVSSKLVDAYELGETLPDRAALLFLKLAEAGHEVAQMNIAHLLDAGSSSLLLPDKGSADDSDHRLLSRSLAQRYYEMSAEQGSASSELRLGDYAYYGWGTSAAFKDPLESSSSVVDGDAEDEALPPQIAVAQPELEIRPQSVDYEVSLARYRKTADMQVTGEWMQAFVARGSFNLGYMHQFGLGVSQDLHLAKRHYQRCREVDPGGVHAPVTIAMAVLTMHAALLRLPAQEELLARVFADVRVHILLLHLLGIVALLILRRVFRGQRRSSSRGRAPGIPRARSVSSTASAASQEETPRARTASSSAPPQGASDQQPSSSSGT